MSISFLMWAMENFSDCNFAICGKTVGSCRRNVIKPLINMMSGRYNIKDKRSENLLTVSKKGKTNTFYIFGGKDESSQDLIQGVTLAGILFDEVALMPRSFVEQGLARCSIEGARFWFNCNPDNPNHWFYREWVLKADEKHALRLSFLMDDNLSLSERSSRGITAFMSERSSAVSFSANGLLPKVLFIRTLTTILKKICGTAKKATLRANGIYP